MDILIFILITVHLFFGLIFCGGPLVCVAEPFLAKGRSWESVKDQLFHAIFFGLVTAAIGGILIGILWSEEMAAAFEANSSRLVFLCLEFFFSIILIWIVCQFFPNPPQKLSAKWLASGLLFLAATNSIYHFPSLMVVFREIRTQVAAESIVKEHYKEFLFSGAILSKWVHVMMASISVTAIWYRLNTSWDAISHSAATKETCLQLNRLDKRLCLWVFIGIVLSWISGFFALKAAGYVQLLGMTGGSTLPTILFTLGVLISFVLVLRNLPKNWDINQEETKPAGMVLFDRIIDLVLVLLLLFFMVQAVDRGTGS